MSDYNVGDLVAEFLQAAGVDTAFGVVSIHNIPMLDGIGRRNAIRMVPARGEMGAGHMADAAARVSGKLGAFFTSTGPGAANATGALVEAQFAGSPVLHLTGQTATGNLDRGQGTVHDVPDQLGMMESVSKSAYRVRSAEEALGVLTRAATEAMTPPRGPVSVEIPIDIQRTPIKRPDELDRLVLPVPAGDAGNPATLDAIADMAAGARRPLLWIGNGGKHARAAVERLTGMGFGVVTSMLGRGVLPESHPMTLGAFNAVPQVEAFYETVDLMIVAGGRLRGHETRDMTLRLPERRVHIDVDPAANGRTYDCDLFHVAEAGAALEALADRLQGRMNVDANWAGDLAKVKAEAIAAFKDGLGAYRDFAETLRAAMPEGALWVRDITISNTTWGNRLLPIGAPEESVYPVGAAIGPGMALGIGAALGAPGRKTVAMCGDGGFFLNLSELWTAAQERPDVVFLVMNDKGYGVIKHIQDSLYGGRHFFADPVGPDLEELAKLAGMPFERVAAADQLGPAMQRAIAVDGPALVEVDINAVGELPRYFAPPPYAQKADAAD
jgi:acetolactate synthase-1/2/3 large subunit